MDKTQKTKQYLVVFVLAVTSIFIIVSGAFLVANIDWSNGINIASSGGSNKKFENLTKEEAINYLMTGKRIDAEGVLPENYVSEEILNSYIKNGNTIVRDLELIYSYDNMTDLKEKVEYKYSDGISQKTHAGYEIKEYDYYAIVTPNRTKNATHCDHGYNADCDALLSFKRSFVDYKRESKNGSNNDVMYVKTNDKEAVSKILRIASLFSNVGFGGHGNIYNYTFDDRGSQYVLTVNNIGAGVNMQTKQGIAINLYHRYFAADKSNGYVHLLDTSTGHMDYIKSFPIDEQEYHSLPGYGY